MIDRDQIVECLEGCLNRSCRTFENGKYCPIPGKVWDAIDSAITMIKEPDPRIIPAKELDAIYRTNTAHIWPYNTPPYLFFSVNPDCLRATGWWESWNNIKACIEGKSPFYDHENYGKVWICWTTEPSKEQIREIPWME